MLTLRSDAGAESSPPGGEMEAVIRGSLKLAEVARLGSTCFVTLSRENATALTVRERSVMERLVRGQSQKAIAYELGVALTTVSAHLRVGLDKLGLRRWEQAVLAGAVLERSRRSGIEETSDLFVARAELCAAALGSLTPTERDVALSVVDGGSNQEIARSRGVSQRTVANQIASVFRKLRVHGRLELIRRLVLPEAAPSAALRLVPAQTPSPEFPWPEQTARGGTSGREPLLVGE